MSASGAAVLVASSADETPTLLCELATGTVLTTLKGAATDSHGLAAGAHIVVGAQRSKNGVVAWRWGKDQPLLRFGAPERLTAVALSADSTLCAGGGASGKVFLWVVGTGELLRAWDAHYGRVAALAFTNDGELLLTGGDDAAVYVWTVAQLARSPSHEDGGASALYRWTAHTLPVTDIACGMGGARGWAATSSLDHTCKAWSLADGSALFSVTCPAPIKCITLTAADMRLVAGATDGHVHIIDLYRRRAPTPSPPQSLPAQQLMQQTTADPIAASTMTARPPVTVVFGSSISDPAESASLGVYTLVAHSAAVNSVSSTSDGAQLITGGADGAVHVWDLAFRQLVRSLVQQRGAVSTVLVMDTPLSLGNSGRPLPTPPPIVQFKRAVRSAEEDRVLMVPLFGGGGSKATLLPSVLSSPPPPTYHIVQPPQPTDSASGPAAEDDRVQALEAQVRQLIAINQQLYQYTVAAAAALPHQSPHT